MPAPFLKKPGPIMHSIEQIWEEILSRDPDKIRTTFKSLKSKDQYQIYSHLMAMSSESGWHPEQKISADAALEVIIKIIK